MGFNSSNMNQGGQGQGQGGQGFGGAKSEKSLATKVMRKPAKYIKPQAQAQSQGQPQFPQAPSIQAP